MSERSRVLTIRGMAKDLEVERALYPETDYWKPRTRAECENGERPCPYVSCQYNLYLDVSTSGSIKLNFPDREIEELTETCALDVADRGGSTLEQVGDLMNLTKERARQIEDAAMRRFRAHFAPHTMEAEVLASKRHLPILQAM